MRRYFSELLCPEGLITSALIVAGVALVFVLMVWQ